MNDELKRRPAINMEDVRDDFRKSDLYKEPDFFNNMNEQVQRRPARN